ncbi:SGNH/GDSL hydrolase family protein [Achromobacter insolitus]|uniref:SGNH/GDSL hydrolase family protein n=1 Tax=Achromobacter insolitus TaxID=217204 RepID=UPI0020A5261E|nr:SGNH/GDSL hydrolase family protein [Achromobacter insolitus]MCP1404242.1 lysophospholipase L1-like esterase [Achromobacter insolitus]
MAGYITAQELLNASTDAGTLGKFANGAANEPNVNRIGNDVSNLATIRLEALEAASAAANLKTYLTKAAMDADTSQPVPTTGRVTNDATASNNGDYVWNGTAWVWSSIQPASISSVDALDTRVDDVQTSLDQVQIEALGRLRRDLTNPLRTVNLRLVGDSITWGSGASGLSPSTPRNGTLSDPRNTLDAATSPTWANLLRRWMTGTFGDGAMVQDAPGSGYSTAKNVIDIFGVQAPNMIWRQGDGTVLSTATVLSKVTAAAGSETGKYLDMYPSLAGNPAEYEFQTNADELEIIYAKTSTGTPETRNVNVYVDGTLALTFSGYAPSASFNNKQAVPLDGALHTVRIRNVGSLLWRMQGLSATRKIKVSNDGIIGSTTYSWINTVPLTGSIQAKDTHVFVQLGTNDRITATNNSVYGLYQRLVQIIASIRTIAPNAEITLLSANAVTQNEGAGSPYSFTMRTVDTVIRDVAASTGCGFVSQFALTLQDKMDGTDITPDGLHPDDATQREMFENIRNRLQVS